MGGVGGGGDRREKQTIPSMVAASKLEIRAPGERHTDTDTAHMDITQTQHSHSTYIQHSHSTVTGLEMRVPGE